MKYPEKLKEGGGHANSGFNLISLDKEKEYIKEVVE